MSRPSRILTCTDFSDASEPAMRRAATMASDAGAELHLVHVMNPSAFIPPQMVVEFPDTAIAEVEKDVGARLEALRARLLDALPPEKVVCAVLSHPNAASAITEYAEEHGIDTIVIGSHGRTGLERWLIGSVAEKVVRHARCDVFVIRSKSD